ncbi:MAG: transposase family protein [Trichodesmium sp.]
MTQILEYLNNHPKEVKRVIGITDKQLKKLMENAQIIAKNKKMEMGEREKLLIKAGGGRKKILKVEEEIILTLYYLHHIPTFQILGINFGVSESTANNIFHYWINILQELLPGSLLEQFQEKEDEYLWIQEILTEQELIVDSTEQSIYRPYDDDKQKKYYSGKKKNHTLKNQIITTERGTEIVDVIVGKRGPESDINLLIQQQKKFDKEQKFQGDKGYQGAERTKIPKKKPRKQELPPEIKEENKKKSQKRIFVEHVIRLIKIFGVARERFRLKDSNYQKVILTICGLVRLRIGAFILV